jgi:hypothetical protein
LCAVEAPFVPFSYIPPLWVQLITNTMEAGRVRPTVVGNRFFMSCNYMPNKQERIYSLKTLISFFFSLNLFSGRKPFVKATQ